MYQDFFNKNDDYLKEFRQKVAEQKIATMEERRSELARSRNNFIGTFAGIALAGIVGWFVLAPQYAETNKEIPTIRRPQTAIKVKPENPGGMEIPNQDKEVYNIVEKKEIDNTVVENLLPTPETPKLPEIAPEVSDIDVNAGNLNQIISEVADSKDTTTNEMLPAKPVGLLVENKKDTPVNTPPKETPKVVAKPTAVKETAKVIAQPSQTATPTITGKWQIQLLVSKNKTNVEKAWKDLSGKYADLQKMPHEIQTSDLGSQGMFYRLRAGSFASKEEAAKACASLKAKGLADCISKER